MSRRSSARSWSSSRSMQPSQSRSCRAWIHAALQQGPTYPGTQLRPVSVELRPVSDEPGSDEPQCR